MTFLQACGSHHDSGHQLSVLQHWSIFLLAIAHMIHKSRFVLRFTVPHLAYAHCICCAPGVFVGFRIHRLVSENKSTWSTQPYPLHLRLVSGICFFSRICGHGWHLPCVPLAVVYPTAAAAVAQACRMTYALTDMYHTDL